METEGNLEAAKSYYKQSLEIRQRIAEETRTIEAYDDLALSCYKMGALGNGSVSFLQKAYDIWSQLSEKCSDDLELRRRCNIVQNLLY